MINGHFADEEIDAQGHSAQRARAGVLILNFLYYTILSLRGKKPQNSGYVFSTWKVHKISIWKAAGVACSADVFALVRTGQTLWNELHTDLLPSHNRQEAHTCPWEMTMKREPGQKGKNPSRAPQARKLSQIHAPQKHTRASSSRCSVKECGLPLTVVIMVMPSVCWVPRRAPEVLNKFALELEVLGYLKLEPTLRLLTLHLTADYSHFIDE